MKVSIAVDGEDVQLELEETDAGWVARHGDEVFEVRVDTNGPGTIVQVDSHPFMVDIEGPHLARLDGREHGFRIMTLSGVAGAPDPTAGAYGPVHAPMTGKVESIEVEVGAAVKQGDVLFVLEAMKMRNQIKAAADGVIAAVHVVGGQAVDTRTAIVDLAPA